MKGRAIPYTHAELRWLKARAGMPRRELYDAFCARFGRTDVSLDALKALCKRRGWLKGRTGRFPKGQAPPNKGKKGFSPPGSEKGWFRPGTRQGVAMRLYKPIGTERMSKDGYIERKINDDLPLQARWRAVHLIRWEAVNGPVPDGHCLKCLDGCRRNTDPDNWLPIPRALLPRLAGRWNNLSFEDAEPEIRRYILAAARLQHAARELRRKKTSP